MSTTFLAEIAPTDNALQFGDAGRIEIWSKPTVSDLESAMAMLAMRNKILTLSFSLLNEEPICEFTGSIAKLNSALRFGRDRAKIKIDVPETELFNAARLIGYTAQPLRLQVAVKGEQSEKPKERSLKVVEPKGPWGDFWRYLWRPSQGFLTHPDMMQAITDARAELGKADDYPLEKLVRDMFGVTSRTFISPDDLRNYLKRYGLADNVGVLAMIRQAERNTQERKAAA